MVEWQNGTNLWLIFLCHCWWISTVASWHHQVQPLEWCPWSSSEAAGRSRPRRSLPRWPREGALGAQWKPVWAKQIPFNFCYCMAIFLRRTLFLGKSNPSRINANFCYNYDPLGLWRWIVFSVISTINPSHSSDVYQLSRISSIDSKEWKNIRNKSSYCMHMHMYIYRVYIKNLINPIKSH